MGLRALNYISLCAGGGGLDLGIELADPGARPVVLVEREAFSCAVLVDAMEQGRLAPAPVWTDARTFDGRPWRGLVDGVIGGIPCQPHSVAGRQLGEDDERDLWSDARRIIVQSAAWWCLIENVPGMLSSGGAERIWRDLSRLGFAVEGGLFSAEEVGASHGRERLFILAVAAAIGRGHHRRPDDALRRPIRGDAAEGTGGAVQPMDDATRDDRGLYTRWGRPGEGTPDVRGTGDRLFAPGPNARDAWLAVLDAAPHLAPAVEPDVRGVADGMAHRVDRLRMLGNGVVPLQAAFAYRTLVARLAERSPAAATLAVRMSA